MLPIKYTDQPEPSFTIYWARSIFDLLFFIIITTLGLNIVVAIIVDRFSELRSERVGREREGDREGGRQRDRDEVGRIGKF